MSDCKLIQNLIEDWCFFLSKLVNDRKVVQSDVFHYYDKDNKFVDFSLMIKNKSLEQSIALLINETFEESNHSPMILSMMYQHCKDRGIIVEETHEIYWLDIEDALMKIWDPKKGITSGNATINLMNSMGNFLNKGKLFILHT